MTRATVRPARAVVGLLVLALLAGCGGATSRPSFVLVVLDTTRAGAVSAYGAVSGTTPNFDRLAREGVLYQHAYSTANWTVPSHASLFTGLPPSRHGMRNSRDTLGNVPTLAETLRAAGYTTAGFTENPWLVVMRGMDRGFERFVMSNGNTIGMVDSWFDERDQTRPFFLFVNLMDAHAPYEVRAENPYLPPGVTATAAKALPQTLADYICNIGPGDRAAAILHGLYLGDVHAADAKLGALIEHVERRGRSPSLVTVVTADHGEYLGEDGRIGHVVGMGESVLHVPLVVHGLRDIGPATIESAVQLIDVMPSLLRWAAVPIPAGLAGHPLPTAAGGSNPPRALVAEYDDFFRSKPTLPKFLVDFKRNMEARCGPGDRVFGDARTVIRFPYKLTWYERYPAELFDLTRDPSEAHDLADVLPETFAKLEEDLPPVAPVAAPHAPAIRRALDPALRERLRALGYSYGGPSAALPRGHGE